MRVEASCNEPFSWNGSLRFEMAGYFALELAYSPAARTADFVCLPGSPGKDFKVSWSYCGHLSNSTDKIWPLDQTGSCLIKLTILIHELKIVGVRVEMQK